MCHGESAHRSLSPACVLPDSRSPGSCELHSVNKNQKKKTKKSSAQYPRTSPNTSLKLPSETSASAQSRAWRHWGQQGNVRPTRENSMQILPVTYSHYSGWGLSQGCQLKRASVDTALPQGQMQQEGPWAKSSWLWGWVLSHPGVH